ncbi:MAG: hypothetical protein J0H69_00640 [Burkholderiales bacterium]|nr:hypothetical protein [Burkholderiales bacterium]
MNSHRFNIAAAGGSATFDNLVQFIRYEEGSAAGNVTPWVRLKTVSGNSIDFLMKPGRWTRLPEPVRGLVIINASGAPDLVADMSLGFGMAGDDAQLGTFDLSSTTLAALESTDLNDATQNVLRQPLLAGANWNSGATMAANTPLTIFAAAANTNGAIVWTAEAQDYAASALVQSFVAKATAPTGVLDGEVVELSHLSGISSTSFLSACRLGQPQRIAPGVGLHFISSVAGSAGQARSCRYTLLP